MVLNRVFLMVRKINDFEYEGELFEQIGKKLTEKLKNYFKEIPAVFTCAAVLNPTLNVGRVETLIEQVAFCFNLTEGNLFFIENQKSHFNNCFENMFDIYLTKHGSSNPIIDQMRASTSSSRGSSSNVNLSLYNTLVNEQSKLVRSSTPTSELGLYMSSNFLSFMTFEEF